MFIYEHIFEMQINNISFPLQPIKILLMGAFLHSNFNSANKMLIIVRDKQYLN